MFISLNVLIYSYSETVDHKLQQLTGDARLYATLSLNFVLNTDTLYPADTLRK